MRRAEKQNLDELGKQHLPQAVASSEGTDGWRPGLSLSSSVVIALFNLLRWYLLASFGQKVFLDQIWAKQVAVCARVYNARTIIGGSRANEIGWNLVWEFRLSHQKQPILRKFISKTLTCLTRDQAAACNWKPLWAHWSYSRSLELFLDLPEGEKANLFVRLAGPLRGAD